MRLQLSARVKAGTRSYYSQQPSIIHRRFTPQPISEPITCVLLMAVLAAAVAVAEAAAEEETEMHSAGS